MASKKGSDFFGKLRVLVENRYYWNKIEIKLTQYQNPVMDEKCKKSRFWIRVIKLNILYNPL